MRDNNQRNNLTAPSVVQDPIVQSGSSNKMLLQLKVEQLESELQLKEKAIDRYVEENGFTGAVKDLYPTYEEIFKPTCQRQQQFNARSSAIIGAY